MIIKTKYRLYHSNQDGFRHDAHSRRFVFAPQYPYRPLGLIIFGPGEAIVTRLLVGNEDQLVEPIAAQHLSVPEDFTIEQLEYLAQHSSMSSVLASIGVQSMAIPTVKPGVYLTVDVTSDVGIVAFWGIEQDI